MTRQWTRLACILALGVLGSSACASPVRKTTPATTPSHGIRLVPQLGLRVASSQNSPDLLANPSSSWEGLRTTTLSSSPPMASLPAPLRIGPDFRIVQVTPTASPVSPDPFLLAFSRSPVLLSESGLALTRPPVAAEISETRFLHQMPELFFHEIQKSWSEPFLFVLDTMPHRVAGVADPLAQIVSHDPFAEERHHSGWLRGKKTIRSAFRDGAKDSDEGQPVVDQLKDWRNGPMNFFLALAGGRLEQETPEGGKLILGPQLSELDEAVSPTKLFRVRYLFGPFEARAETRKAWARYRTELFGVAVALRTAFDYLDRDQSFQLSFSKRLQEQTELRLFGGSGFGSESLTGFSPYPEDFREDRRLAVFLVLDRRF